MYSHTVPAVCALTVLLASSTSFGQVSSTALLLSPLPVERVFPLTGELRSCAVFRKGSALSDDSIRVSATPKTARIRIANHDSELPHVQRAHKGSTWMNS